MWYNNYENFRGGMELPTLIFITIILIILVYILIAYNIIIKRKNAVKHAKSTIEVYLTQRFDLIPNLVECVKEYSKYEENLFIKITNLRTEFMKEKELSKGALLDKEIDNVILTLENYPELKANEQFLNLQKNLTKMENQIQAARRIYNNEVEKYNNVINVFPNSILSKIFKFESEEFFQKDDK